MIQNAISRISWQRNAHDIQVCHTIPHQWSNELSKKAMGYDTSRGFYNKEWSFQAMAVLFLRLSLDLTKVGVFYAMRRNSQQ
jgi:hypothetical protein